jgi:YVTN family beta-propeller protein
MGRRAGSIPGVARRHRLATWAAVVVVAAGGSLATAVRLTASAQTSVPCGGPTGTAYVAEAGYDAFGAIDTANCAVLQTYNVDDPGNPGDASDANYSSTDEEVVADGTNLYFADTGSSTVAVIDSADLNPSNYSPAETLINVGLFPQGLAVTPNGSQVWVADTGPQTTGTQQRSDVAIIDAADNQVVGGLALAGEAQQIAFSPNGRTAYVTTSQGVDVVNVASESVITVLRQFIDPHGVAVSPNGREVYVTDAQSGRVVVFSTATNQVVGAIAVGQLPWQVVFSADGSTAYVANPDSNTVSVIDTATNSVSSTLQVTGDPDTLALTPDGSELWVGSQASGYLEVIQTSNGQQVGDIDLGTAYEPTGFAMTG